MLGEHIQSQHLVIVSELSEVRDEIVPRSTSAGKSNHDRLTFEWSSMCMRENGNHESPIRAFRLPPGGISLMVAITAAVMMYMR
jgi:hypothetical protein